MNPRQARRERREADRKAKKLESKKNRLAAAGTFTPDPEPDVPARWNPELEDEFPREVQIRNNAIMDRISLKRGLPLPPPGPAPNSSIESLREYLAARKPALTAAVPEPPASSAEPGMPPPGFVSHGETPRSPSSNSGRAAGNRLNAQHSTGPRTSHGKLASSRNALKHGLASGELIIPGEDRAAFDALLEDFQEEHRPATPTEELLIEEMARSHWLTRRALRFQNECFTAAGVNEKQLALFLRYQTTHQRAFYRALTTLLQLQKARRQAETGFVSQPRSARSATAGFVSHASSETRSDGQFLGQNPPDSLRSCPSPASLSESI